MRFGLSGPRFFGIRPWVSFPLNQTRARESGKTSQSFLYVIHGNHNMVKIGVTTNPAARIARLRTASPFPLSYSFIGLVQGGTGYDIEREAHAYLDMHRCEGEWFDVSTEVAIEAIQAATAKLGREPVKSVTEPDFWPAFKADRQRPRWGFSNCLSFVVVTFIYDMFMVIPIAILAPETGEPPLSLFVATAVFAMAMSYFSVRPSIP